MQHMGGMHVCKGVTDGADNRPRSRPRRGVVLAGGFGMVGEF